MPVLNNRLLTRSAACHTERNAVQYLIPRIERFFGFAQNDTFREVVILSPQSLRASSSCQSGAVCSAARLSLRDDANNRCLFWLVEGIIVTLRRILTNTDGYERGTEY